GRVGGGGTGAGIVRAGGADRGEAGRRRLLRVERLPGPTAAPRAVGAVARLRGAALGRTGGGARGRATSGGGPAAGRGRRLSGHARHLARCAARRGAVRAPGVDPARAAERP